jgi:hypothetical protein
VGRKEAVIIRECSEEVWEAQNVQYRLPALEFWEDKEWKTNRKDHSRGSQFGVQDVRLLGYNAV